MRPFWGLLLDYVPFEELADILCGLCILVGVSLGEYAGL